MQRYPSSPVQTQQSISTDGPIDHEEIVSDSTDIGIVQSPHSLALPERTFHHLTVEEDDDANRSTGHHRLLSGPDSRSDGSNVQQGDLTTMEIHNLQDQNTPSGLIGRIPWAVLLAFMGNLVCTALSIYVLVVSDQTAQTSWSIQPSVYLAVLAPLGNILLQYCLSQGLVNDWWTFASRKTTLGALHGRWEHGTSIISAATSFKTFDKISAAKILITATFAVNPLLQRASRPFNQATSANVTVPFQLATTKSSFLGVGFKSAYTDAFSDPIQLSPAMVLIMRDYTTRAPIINQFGSCPGNCTGTVRAAGIVSNCTRTVNETYRLDHESYGENPSIVFEAKTNVMNYQTHTDFNLSAFYIKTKLGNDTTTGYGELGPPGTVLPEAMQSCDGVSTQAVCVLKHAVLEYPIVLRNNVISVDTRASAVKVVQTENNGQVDNSGIGEAVFTGFSLAANSITQSAVNMSTAGRMGWNYESTGPLPYFYMENEQNTNLTISCQMTFTDPTDDILATFNEIMFRISLAAFASSSNTSLATNYTLAAEEPVIRYESRYIYLVAATFISLLACCAVLPTFNGFWKLDRPFSLSPIEIANAFDAPLLRLPAADNLDLPVETLIKRVGSTEVQYITVVDAHKEAVQLRQKRFAVPTIVA
jgi:hypothetical protein